MNLLTVAEVAARLGCSPALIYLLCSQRKMPHHHLGIGRGTIRIREEDLGSFLEQCKVPPTLYGGKPLAELRHIRLK